MVGDIELAAVVIAVGIIISSLILGIALVVAAGRMRKRE